jgi:hypothetical protein
MPAAAGAFASDDDAPGEGGEDDPDDLIPGALSRLSFCIAWLFGLEAFLSEPDGRSRAPRG